jgi:hypothetical protein
MSYAWLGALILLAVIFVFEKRETLDTLLKTLDTSLLIEVMLLLLIGKLALVYVVQQGCLRCSIPLDLADTFYIHNVTQMAKYVPGSVWQLVGFFAMLRERGVGYAKIRDAAICEHLWGMGFAALAGLIIVSYRADVLLPRLFGGISLADPAWQIVVGASAVLLCLGVVILTYLGANFEGFQTWMRLLVPSPRVIFALAIGWVVFGMSFWVMLPSLLGTPPPWLYVVGVYCLGHAIGFLVPFAPAGLGVREGIIAVCMTPYLPFETSIFLASLNRGLYFIVELILFSVAMLQHARKISPRT